MIRGLKKEQSPKRRPNRSIGVVIDCEEVMISVFPPPREHGKPHCHVRSKIPLKARGRKSERFPEVKVYLDGSEFIVVKEGFSLRDLKIIADIIFNDSSAGEMTNDLYLLQIWEKLHGKS